ncbi:DeoR/GlpR family DNA-binding transcription regulator [Granulosicoccus antarcticus]|uniref:Glucitol operon repressor n=1 Tax=Granulosicoccus antarcticus IMCC3135 TaxID=1192854 RepID=A0A2Z2NT63_9GAMM|nr:DeoR/GlpR family DNA-binding transcription regulator [Granulosicoccus antarcticus]ASJ73715.1 Glucitol operon repressor [Granulosicoccus antarcticus IMCC3135]
MTKSERFTSIRKHLYSTTYSSVHAIATAVGASLATVRRDLQELEQAGVIIREHGGASISESVEIEVAFEQRVQHNLLAKRVIADAAYREILPHSSIFLDAGTTVYQLARRIRLEPFPVNIFSNCISVAQEFSNIDGVSVTLLGGRVRPENASMVGSIAEQTLDQLWFDHLFLGCGAIADDGCIYGVDADESRLNQKMLTRASKKHLLVDSSKFGRHLTYRVAELGDDINLFTDSNLDALWSEKLEEKGVHVTIVYLPAANEDKLDATQ